MKMWTTIPGFAIGSLVHHRMYDPYEVRQDPERYVGKVVQKTDKPVTTDRHGQKWYGSLVRWRPLSSHDAPLEQWISDFDLVSGSYARASEGRCMKFKGGFTTRDGCATTRQCEQAAGHDGPCRASEGR